MNELYKKCDSITIPKNTGKTMCGEKDFLACIKKFCHTWLDPQKPILYNTCCLTNALDMNLQEGTHLSISIDPFLFGQSVKVFSG